MFNAEQFIVTQKNIRVRVGFKLHEIGDTSTPKFRMRYYRR
jgi:hypothetical protein